MPWWPKRTGAETGARSGGRFRDGGLVDVGPPNGMAGSIGQAAGALGGARSAGQVVRRVDMARLAAALDRLDVRYLTDGDGSLLAMWERHAVLFALEGPDDEILVVRTRPHGTVPPDWADRAYRVVNEWNHTRRFCKAYVGDPTERNQLPIYGETQVPLVSGVHDALLTELVDCATAVSAVFVDWLYDEGGLL